MSILNSLNIGTTGLAATGQGLAVIADNIANAVTTGFKSSRAEFQDVLARSIKGLDGGDQIGAGVKISHIKPNFLQGSVSRTENVTDLAINGNGFFALETGFGPAYTRDGSFHFDKEGAMINGDGYRVMGFQANEDEEITNKVGAIKLGSLVVPARATDAVKFDMNFDSRAKIQEFDVAKAEDTSSFNTTVVVYDNVGSPRIVGLYLNKIGDNHWQYHAVVDGKDAASGKEGTPVEMSRGQVIFNDKGNLQDVKEDFNAYNFNNGAAPGQRIKFDFGKTIMSGGTGLDASTQYGSNTSIARNSQNGSSAGSLSSLSFDDTGLLTATYSNGRTVPVAQVALAKFENNEGLFKLGKNLFKASSKTGEPALGRPTETGRGEVLCRSIELSNVDMANEFVNMMTMQRNFQANAKTLSTADQLLQDVINIKR